MLNVQKKKGKSEKRAEKKVISKENLIYHMSKKTDTEKKCVVLFAVITIKIWED